MFNVGDRVRYTGKYRDACKYVSDTNTFGPIDEWVINDAGYGKKSTSRVVYATNKTKASLNTAFFAGDLELAGPVEPEEYEAWFVA